MQRRTTPRLHHVAPLAMVAAFAWSGASASRRQATVVDGRDRLPLALHLDLLEERPGQRYTLKQLRRPPLSQRFRRNDAATLNFGSTKSAYWARIRLRSVLKVRRRMLLEIANPSIDSIEVHIGRSGGDSFRRVLGGEHHAGVRKGRIPHRNMLVPVIFDPGEKKTLYVRMASSGPMQIVASLWLAERFVEHDSRALFGYGIFYGLLIVLLLYNLLLFLAVRDRSYLLHVLATASILVLQGSLDGFTQRYIWGDLSRWSDHAMLLSVYAANTFLLLFSRQFLRLSPLWTRMISSAAWVMGSGVPLSLLVPYRVGIIAAAALSIASVALMVSSAWASMRSGFRPARYVFAAWAAMFVCMAAFVLSRFGVLPWVTLTEYGQHLGMALNVLLLSFAIADRIDLLRTDTESAQQQLRRAYRDLAEQDELKSRFFANVSHEVRTPLTLILAPLERLIRRRGQDLPQWARESLDAVHSNSWRLLQLVNQLLDFSRLEAGNTTASFEQVSVGALVKRTVDSFEAFASSKGLRLEQRGEEQLPKLWTEEEKVAKALSTLLTNAIRFTPTGGRIVVRVTLSTDEVQVAVIDTGSGIAAEELPQLFDRSRAAQDSQGAGVGLALSKQMIELVGGRLSVDSEESVGTTATIRLPRGKAHVDEIAPAEQVLRTRAAVVEALTSRPEVGEESRVRSDHEGALVAVVADNPEILQLIVGVCRSDGFEVAEVKHATVEQMTEQIRELSPALVIHDASTSKEELALLEAVRGAPAVSRTPVMLLTSEAAPQKRIDGLEGGADDYLLKPFERRELLARAHNLVRLSQQQRRLQGLNARLQEEAMTQASAVEGAMLLGRYLPREVVRAVIEGDEVRVQQQRRTVTVFRLELRGFDEFSAGLEPEEVAAILNSYLSEMMNVAFSHGATVDRFIRDAVIGFFGAPTSEGEREDARRCAAMAKDMWRRASAVCERWQGLAETRLPLPTMVITTGAATVGNFGCSSRLEYTAVGGPMEEVGMLLQELADGELQCAASTWTLIEGDIAGESCGEVKVGKHSRPVVMHRLERPELAGRPGGW